MQIGEIAATAAGHQDLLADAIGAFDHQHAPPARAGGRCTHQAGGTAADDDHVKMLHGLWNWCVSRDRRVSFEPGILVIASRIAAKQSSSAPDRAADWIAFVGPRSPPNDEIQTECDPCQKRGLPLDGGLPKCGLAPPCDGLPLPERGPGRESNLRGPSLLPPPANLPFDANSSGLLNSRLAVNTRGAGAGGTSHSLRRLICSCWPQTQTFCRSRKIFFGMPSGRSMRL